MDLVTLSRWQFAITTVYHFFFVPLTLGLSIFVAILETIYVSTGQDIYKKMARFWGTLFLINFTMGVVTGIVQEFQFGMNWANYSRFVGDIFGAPLAIEALLAFFLESTFLQHFYVVVGFQHQHVRGADAFQHQFGDVAEVGGKTDVATGGAQNEAHRILRVVRNGKSFDADITDFKAATGVEQAPINFRFQMRRAIGTRKCRFLF